MKMDEIRKNYTEAQRLARQKVEKEARKILLNNEDLDEFIMGMGRAFFTLKDEDNSGYNHAKDEDPRFKPVFDILGEWDDVLGTTGYPVRFTAKGERKTNW